MSEHTPGPWTFDGEEGIVKEGVVTPYHGIVTTEQRIAAIYVANDFDFPSSEAEEDFQEEAIANARLIAAAPDLLAACKTALRYLTVQIPYSPSEQGDSDFVPTVQALRAAIAKAKGDQGA